MAPYETTSSSYEDFHWLLKIRAATAGGDGVLHAQVCHERLLKANDVVVTMLAQAILGGIGGVFHLQFGDRGFGVEDLADLAAAHGCCLTS